MNRRIIRVNPIREMVEMQRALDRFFEDAWRNSDTTAENGTVDAYTLPVDVLENNERYIVSASLPGGSDEHIDISLDNDTLFIVAELPEIIANEESERILIQERRTGKFARRLRFNRAIDAENVEASLSNGVLTLSLPVVPEVQPRQIQIKSGNSNN